MENGGYALKMAGGILLVVLLVSLLVYTFERMKRFPNENQTRKQEEQIQIFNREYEAYNKRQMYGTDVISCLNLAYNNNTSLRVFSDDIKTTSLISSSSKGIEERRVEVSVELKNLLQTTVDLYYYNPRTHSESKVGGIADSDFKIKPSLTLKEVYQGEPGELEELISILKGIDSSISENTTIEAIKNLLSNKNYLNLKSIKLNKQFHIEAEKTASSNSKEVKKLMEFTGKPIIEIKNKNFNYTDNTWTKIIIRTPAYDLKKRKFRCEKIDYYVNSNDVYAEGRVRGIVFKEI